VGLTVTCILQALDPLFLNQQNDVLVLWEGRYVEGSATINALYWELADKQNKLAIGNFRNRLRSKGFKGPKPSGTSASHEGLAAKSSTPSSTPSRTRTLYLIDVLILALDSR
jgi:hypothetical protein